MKQWYIKVVGKQRKEIDKHLIVQAVLALGRQLKEHEVRQASEPATPEDHQ